MPNNWIQHWLIVVLATLVGGCSAWTGPRAAVEDRRAPGLDRANTVASSKAAGGPRDARKVSARKAPNRKGTEKAQREERQLAKEDTGDSAQDIKAFFSVSAHASADVLSSDDRVLELKP